MFTEYLWQFLFQLGLQKDSYTATESPNRIENFGQQAEIWKGHPFTLQSDFIRFPIF